jgi:tetratricopeptide (TPR) repeat protein
LLELSRLPAPGGEADVEFLQAQPTSVQNRPQPNPISVLAPPQAAPKEENPGAELKTRADEGEPVQTQPPQDFQKAQNELKKALIAERKQREAAQKRVEELEAKLAKVGDVVPKTTGGVPSEGVFEDVRYPVLLARCRAEAFTGAIVMQSGGATRNVYLKDGLPVAFHSSEPGERIGKVLVTQGRITDAQYMQATTRSVERSIKLTDALVELGWMDAETIAVEQRNLARDQIIQSFELVQGRFTVSQGTSPDANTATFDFGPGEIYVQGYRRYAPTSEMMAAYEALRDKYLIANARLASYRPKLGLTGEDERLLRLLGEALTVEEAVERASVTPEAAARLLSALQALELVEEWSPGVEQFRSRIRMEKQRHAEEMNQQSAEARARETRLLEAFEKALSKLGAGSLSAQLDHNDSPPPALSPPKPSFTPMSSSSAPSTSPLTSSLGSRSSTSPASPGVGGLSASASVGLSGSSRPSPTSPTAPSSASSSASSASSFVHSASAAQSVTVGSEASSSAPPSPSNGAAVKPAAREAPVAASSPPLSVADQKYKEGVEQAAQNRLDEAEVTLREAVRLDASKPEYLTSLARVLLANPRYERAGTLPVVRSLLDRAVQIAPDFNEAAELHAQVIKEMSG